MLFNWISAAYPEILSRSFFENKNVQVFDPIFIFQTDSSVWELKSDSTLSLHRNKWQWDAVTGGRYKIINDSLYLFISVVWSADKQEPVKMEFRESGLLSQYSKIFSNAIFKMFTLMHVELTASDTANLKKVISPFAEAFQTYCAGYLYEMRGNIPAALTAYSRSLEIDPSMGVAACRLGLIYTLQKKYEVARNLFEQTLHKDPTNPFVIAYMAEFLSDYEQFTIAALFVEKYRTQLSLTSKGLRAAGAVYLRQGEYQRAIAILTQALAAGSSNLDVEFLLGQAWLHTGEYVRAIDIFNRLIKCRPDYLRYYSSLGSVYRKSGQLMQAAMTLQSALALGPRDVVIMIDLSQIWIDLKWYEKALLLLKQAEEINPEIGDIYVNTGLAYWYSGNQVAANKYFTKSLRFSEVKQSALINIGNISFTKKEYKKAITFYKKAAKNGKLNESLEYNLALSYLNLNDKVKAIEHFDAFLALSPMRTDILQLRSQLSIELEKYDDAIHFLQRIIDISPQDNSTVRQMVDVYSKIKKYDEAVKILEEYLAYVPSNRDFRLLLAKVYLDRGWFEVATQKYQEIIQDFPESSDGYTGLGLSMYKLIEQKKASNYDDVIFTLKYALQYAPGNPLPDELIGDIYFNNKGYRELALEHWNAALTKTTSESEKKKIKDKIRLAK